MGHCTLDIIAGADSRTVRPGDRISGRVEVQTSDELSCKGLQVALVWRTSGKGTVDTRTAEQEVVFQGKWSKGQTHEYPFELRCPTGPLSYTGHNVQIEWALVATADIPWKIDPIAEVGLELVPGPESSDKPFDTRIDSDPNQPRSGRSSATVGLVVITGFLVLMGPGLVAMGAHDMRTTSGSGLGYLIPGLGFTGLLVGWIYLLTRNRLAERRLGAITCVARSSTIHPGESLEIQLGFPVSQSTRINQITFTLEGLEVATARSGKHVTTHQHTLHKERVSCHENALLATRQPFSHTQCFDLPPAAAFSFRTRNNRVSWRVIARIDIDRWPDYQTILPIAVVPTRR